MGVLTDYFAAPDDEGAKRALDSGPLAAGLPTVESKSLDPVVTMATLEEILTGSDAMQIIQGGDDPLVALAGDEGPWLFRIRPSLLSVLREPDAARLQSAATAWAATEELKGSDSQDLYVFLWNLAHLNSWAVRNGQAIYCWTSL
jgi:hypothetical protein